MTNKIDIELFKILNKQNENLLTEVRQLKETIKQLTKRFLVEPPVPTGSVDAMDWAKSFITYKLAKDWSLDDIDERLMLGWFASAMVAAEKYKPLKWKIGEPEKADNQEYLMQWDHADGNFYCENIIINDKEFRKGKGRVKPNRYILWSDITSMIGDAND